MTSGGELHLWSRAFNNFVKWLLNFSRDLEFEINRRSSLSMPINPAGMTEVMLKCFTLPPPLIQIILFSMCWIIHWPSHQCLSYLYNRTGSATSRMKLVWVVSFYGNAGIIVFSAWIVAISRWKFIKSSIFSACSGRSRFRTGTECGIPNTIIDGESPEGLVVSFFTLMERRRINSSSTDEFYVLSFRNIWCKGWW